MGFFDNVFNSLTGQRKAAPYNPLGVEEGINQSVPIAANANINYNNILQPALTKLGLQSEATVNPFANQLEQTTTKKILDELNLGGELPDEIKRQVTRSALQSGVSSGLGISPAGRTVVARDLGLTGLDLLNQRLSRAQAFTPVAANLADRFYDPKFPFDPYNVFGDLQLQRQNEVQHAADEQARKAGNFSNMLNTFGRIGGGIIGGIYGGPAGAKAGSAAGGSIFQNPYEWQSSGNRGFSSLLNSPGGMNLLGKIFGSKGGDFVPATSSTPAALTAGNPGLFGGLF